MLKEEFIARTGYTPTNAEYAVIEEDYYAFDGDKDAFCKAFDVEAFKAEYPAREIEKLRRINENLNTRVDILEAELSKCAVENATLKKALEEEQEWKLSDGAGTNMEQEIYESLVRGGYEMKEAEAKAWIHDNFGFAEDLVEILHEASTMEVSRHHKLRVAETFRRPPIYEATDWNYARFNVLVRGATHRWEVVNGELMEYRE